MARYEIFDLRLNGSVTIDKYDMAEFLSHYPILTKELNKKI